MYVPEFQNWFHNRNPKRSEWIGVEATTFQFKLDRGIVFFTNQLSFRPKFQNKLLVTYSIGKLHVYTLVLLKTLIWHKLKKRTPHPLGVGIT